MANQQKPKLHFQVKGTGKPLVLLHGFLESSSMWEELDFGSDRQLVSVDLPGHGFSDYVPEWHDSMFKMAQAVEDIMNELNFKHYDVIGHSMGGYVALELKKHNSRCEKVLLLNSNFWQDSDQKVRDRKRVAEIVQHNKNLFINEAIPNLFQNPSNFQSEIGQLIDEAKKISWESIAGASIAMSQRMDNEDVIRKFQSDVCIIQGAFDTVVPKSVMEMKVKDLDVTFAALNSGHMAHFECRDELERVIQNFLK